MAADEPTLFCSRHGMINGAWRRYLFTVYTGETSEQSVTQLRDGFAALRRLTTGPYALYTVVDEHAPLPPSAVREGLANFMQAQSDHLRASALVQEGGGFRASAVRSVAVGISLLARQPYPHKVFASTEEASAWLASSFDPDLDPSRLSRAIERLRQMA